MRVKVGKESGQRMVERGRRATTTGRINLVKRVERESGRTGGEER